MPAALDVDREQVRMLAVSVGVREAARQMDLPEATVQAWAARYGWIKNLPRSHPLPVTMVKLRATNATTAPEAQRNIIAGKLLRTRENHLDVALAVSERLKEMPASVHLDKDGAQILLATGKHAALVGGWNADSRPDSPGKAFGSRNSGLEIDAEVLDAPQPEENAAIVPIPDGVSTNVDDY